MNIHRIAAIVVTAAHLASGHDLYLMPDKFVVAPGVPLRVVYQNGDAFPKGSTSTRPDRLRNTRLLSKSGTSEFEKITPEAEQTTASVLTKGAGLAILTSSTIPNFIELDAAKFKSYLEHENLTNAVQWREQNGETDKAGRERYSKYVKSLIRVEKSDGFFKERTGLTIEIIPEVDPYSVKPGARLPVQVLFRGKPAIDVAVESAWLEGGRSVMENIGRTDRQGRIVIPVKAIGPHRLHAIVMERCAEPKAADWESFWASLTFEIPR